MRTDQLAIGVISCERGAITQRCLDSIRSCTVAPYHIYVVDNGSRSETTRSYLDQWEGQRDVTVKRLDSNHGEPAARNHILDMAGRTARSIRNAGQRYCCPGWLGPGY